MKRIASALTALFVLHLTFVSADVACADHGTAASHATPVASMHHHGPMSQHDRHKRSKDCKTPVTLNCCGAMSACAPTFATAPAGAGDAAWTQAAVRWASDAAPSSRGRAPEPPPPRA